MNRLSIPTDIVSRALLAIAIVLFVVVAFEIVGIMTGPAAADLAAVDETNSLPPVSAGVSAANNFPPLGSYSEILRRPVYEATRRPANTRNVAEDSASAERIRQKWRLSGIILDKNNIAILETNRPGETLSLIAGQSLDGWRVQEINASDVVLIRGGESLRFTLHEEGAKVPVVARKRNTKAWKPSDK